MKPETEEVIQLRAEVVRLRGEKAVLTLLQMPLVCAHADVVQVYGLPNFDGAWWCRACGGLKTLGQWNFSSRVR